MRLYPDIRASGYQSFFDQEYLRLIPFACLLNKNSVQSKKHLPGLKCFTTGIIIFPFNQWFQIQIYQWSLLYPE